MSRCVMAAGHVGDDHLFRLHPAMTPAADPIRCTAVDTIEQRDDRIICGIRAGRCICGLDPHAAGTPHRCLDDNAVTGGKCNGGWLGSGPDPTPVRWPDPWGDKPVDGSWDPLNDPDLMPDGIRPGTAPVMMRRGGITFDRPTGGWGR